MSLAKRLVLKATTVVILGYWAAFAVGHTSAPVQVPAPAAPGEHSGPESAKAPVSSILAVSATDVRLLPGSPFEERQELHRKGLLASYDPDKLLFHYRALAKLPQHQGVNVGYAGWDSGFLRGHMAGHYLSAASRMAAATGDNLFRERANYLVAELAKCQEALGLDGYLAAFPSTVFDRLEGKPGDAGGIVVPYYTVQKIMSGLVDAYHYLGNQQALDVALKMANHFGKRLAGLDAAQIEKMFRTDGSRNPQNEFGAMSDVYAELYKITGNPTQLATARIFNRPWFVGPLSKGEDHLGGLHANTHIAQALGLANCANLEGDADELKASENFWWLVTRDHSFVIGGNSFKEWFDKSGVETGASIDGQKELPATTAETCNTHNMLKLTARLFERTPDVEFANYFERALYNHVLASVAPDTGAVTYFTPMRGDFRTYLDGSFCCTGTGIENTARYNEGIYFKKNDSLYINLYIPSELTWRETGMVLRQEGDITRGEAARFTVVKAGGGTQRLNFRIPSWTAKPAVIKLNDRIEEAAGKPSSYVALERQWKTGDVIALMIPAALRVEAAKDNSSVVSIFFGPMVLAGELGRDQMPNNDTADKDAYLKMPSTAVPDIVSDSADPTQWLQPLPNERSSFVMRNAGPANGIKFRPLYDVHHQRYSVYWRFQKIATANDP